MYGLSLLVSNNAMNFLPVVLLRDREAFWHALRARGLGWRDLLGLAIFIGVVCALYGTVMAGWRSPRLSLYVALKLPALFLGTAAMVAGFNWMTASLLTSGLSLRSTLFVVFACQAVVHDPHGCHAADDHLHAAHAHPSRDGMVDERKEVLPRALRVGLLVTGSETPQVTAPARALTPVAQ